MRNVYIFSHYILSLAVLDLMENLQIVRSETALNEEWKICFARNFEIQHFSKLWQIPKASFPKLCSPKCFMLITTIIFSAIFKLVM